MKNLFQHFLSFSSIPEQKCQKGLDMLPPFELAEPKTFAGSGQGEAVSIYFLEQNINFLPILIFSANFRRKFFQI